MDIPGPEKSVFIWGRFGEESTVPQKITELQHRNISKVSSGGNFFLAASQQGEVWGWGQTKYNRFGHTKDIEKVLKNEFAKSPFKINLKIKVNKIAAGNWHSLLTDINGNLFGCGHNRSGALGTSNFENVPQFTNIQNIQASQISAGDRFSLIISIKGQLFGTGRAGLHGYQTDKDLCKFKPICKDEQFSKVSAGFTHSLAITLDGRTFSWGQGNFNQLGHGDKSNVQKPKIINSLLNEKIISVSCSRGEKFSHSMAISKQGKIFTWGCGYKGKLGHAEQWNHDDPADEVFPRKITFQKETLNKKTTKESQHLQKVNKEKQSQMIQSQKDKAKGQDQVNFTEKSEFKDVFAGGIHSGALSKNGELLTFGCGSDGRLGHAQSSEYRYLYREGLPRPIGALKDWEVIQASFSYYHNICLAKRK